ncbi:MAG: right-handed parallel beta-helix repeat-containing protein, partial [Candidatus Thorarchaeota archaeon]
MKRLFITAMLASLTISMLTLPFNVQPVIASGTIYIRADGSIEGTTQIFTADNITYTFTGNIYDSIVVERDNITLDGQRYLLQGSGSGWGITLSGRSNVTLRDIEINMFNDGIRLTNSSDNTISGNTITYTMDFGVLITSSSNNNTVSGNTIAESYDGIVLAYSS